MMTKEKQDFGVRYNLMPRSFVVTNEKEGISSLSFSRIVRDISPGGSKAYVREYLREISLLYMQKIKEFEGLERRATEQEQKQLYTFLRLLVEAQDVLYDEDA